LAAWDSGIRPGDEQSLAVTQPLKYKQASSAMLPAHIGVAANEGDLDTIRAYFEDDSIPATARDVDDVGNHLGWTPLMMAAEAQNTDRMSLEHVEVARYLLSRGASIDKKDAEGHTALLIACYCGDGTVTEMVELLLSAGADPNVRNEGGRTPISAHVRFGTPTVECVTALLRAGASLDRVFRDQPIEWHFSADYARDTESFWPTMRTLVAGVRRNGSFKRYMREPHREVLALRGLAMRGHLVPRRRTRGAAGWKAAVAFLARHGDNGVVWNVLSFWRATK
jgi:hypothetical protein